MSILVNIGTILVGLALIIIVIGLIVKKQLSESQSVLWIVIGLAVIVLAAFPDLIPWIAAKLGIWYAPSVLLLVASIGLLLIAFYNSVVTSKYSNELNELALQISLLKEENEEIKKKLGEMEGNSY